MRRFFSQADYSGSMVIKNTQLDFKLCVDEIVVNEIPPTQVGNNQL